MAVCWQTGLTAVSLVADPSSAAAAALVAYVAGFAAVLAWTRRVHRRHGVRELGAALPAAFTGGALGGTTALLFATADQMDVLGL
jgi:hypothetical protein